MTERVFTYTWNAEKRFSVLVALGAMWTRLANTPEQAKIEALIEELIATPGQDSSPALPHPQGGTAAARAVLAPTPKDYFAADRQGNIPSTPPTAATLQTPVTILQTNEKGAYLGVIFSGGTGNCFDKQLWPALKNRANDAKPVGLWVKKSDDGKYNNIVGVRQ